MFKINETHFIYTGLNEYNKFCYELYEILNVYPYSKVKKECYDNSGNLNFNEI